MMISKLKLFIFFCFIIPGLSEAQTFPIGHRAITLNDPVRSRDISCHFYYPAMTSGDNTTVATGQFPVIVFGHGFVMTYEAYMNFVDSLVPYGYIICLPTTESGLSPSHSSFGLDLKFLNNEIELKGNSDPAFFLYQKTSGKSAIMGHSMGGGAAFLAAENNTNLTTLVTFAAAETSASAISAAANVTVPAILFIGENDGVTLPVNHQIPMYNNLPAGCKGYVTILGGGHCYFANNNLACTTGEMFTSPQPSITRAQQHQAMFIALKPYLDWILKNDTGQRQVFESIIAQSTVYNSLFACNTVNIEEDDEQPFIYPNPVNDFLNIHPSAHSYLHFSIFSIHGELLQNNFIKSNLCDQISVDMRNFNPGIYFLRLQTETFYKQLKIIKL